MKYFYDTEFLEDGNTIDFISIGIVAEDGREFYAVSTDFDTDRVAQHRWLMDNVMPSIGHETGIVFAYDGAPVKRWLYVTDDRAMTRDHIAWQIEQFIGADEAPELWAWYSAYDHVCLAQLWGRMLDLPKAVPMYTNDIKTLVQEVKRKQGKGPVMPKQPTGHHNALDDARFNVVRYNYLRGLLDGTN